MRRCYLIDSILRSIHKGYPFNLHKKARLKRAFSRLCLITLV